MTIVQETRVQLEPAETDLNLSTPHLDRRGTASGHPEPDQRPSREGLPAAFKMRGQRHYVEQLMGDAPLRTVREIPVADVDPPDGETTDVERLEQSIKDVGILQPLLVTQHGARYRIIAGGNRYRAAVRLDLRTVPCLVCETGTHSVEALRAAAARRAAPPPSTEQSMPGAPAPHGDVPRSEPAADGLREVTARLAFVSAVMPALDVAGYDPLRWNILTDLMRVEMERARSTAASIEWLSAESLTPVRESVDAAALFDQALDAVGPEARLQNVKLELSSTLSGYRLQGDSAMLVRALIGLIQGMLDLSPPGSTLRIDGNGTAVRPALIVSVTQDDCEIDETAAARFFDAGFAQHPNHRSGALVLAGVSRVARLHGGRAHARTLEGRGCTATFVIPKPVEDI